VFSLGFKLTPLSFTSHLILGWVFSFLFGVTGRVISRITNRITDGIPSGITSGITKMVPPRADAGTAIHGQVGLPNHHPARSTVDGLAHFAG
jgi:hypothetical protein